ncbi:MAG: nitrogen regulation protein NR(I) [Gammaproteobacteria bacterium]|nr:nitrogen regulation protein NR(I) [Gammaproteobacteria bacterium]
MKQLPVVWVVDDDRSIRWVLEKALKQGSMHVKCFESGDDALSALPRSKPDVIMTDIKMPGISGIELLSLLNRQYPEIPVIIMTAYSDLDSAVSSYREGAFEYLPKPFDIDSAVSLANRAVEFSRKNRKVATVAESEEGQKEQKSSSRQQEIIGEAPSMQEVFRSIGRLSTSNISVLITGESGTGKELVAHALHRHSPRRDAPFIAINTAAIPKDLLESELFGHERGAFTGAQSAREGRFQQADGGTLFLDEIGDMPAELQTRLLRVLSDGEFYRVGGHRPVTVDVRILAATHQNLEKRVEEGLFRADLFHRLNVIRIHVPALRERKEDIPLLTAHFLRSISKELKAEPKRILNETMEYLQKLDWPGNVRQLENICRWITVMAPGQEVKREDLPPELVIREKAQAESEACSWMRALRKEVDLKLLQGEGRIIYTVIPQVEEILIDAALQICGGRRSKAAERLGWGRNTLTRKINDLGLNYKE